MMRINNHPKSMKDAVREFRAGHFKLAPYDWTQEILAVSGVFAMAYTFI